MIALHARDDKFAGKAQARYEMQEHASADKERI